MKLETIQEIREFQRKIFDSINGYDLRSGVNIDVIFKIQSLFHEEDCEGCKNKTL